MPPSDNIGQCDFVVFSVIHAAHTPTHPVQTMPANLSVPPLSSSVTCIVPHMMLHLLPPNSCWPSPLLVSNLYALPPTDFSYHPDVRNPQIHSTFEVGESSAHSNLNMLASAFSSGIAHQQLEGIRQQIATIEATLGVTSNTPS